MSDAPLDGDECAVWLALKRLSGQALAAVGHDIEAKTGLSGADFSILTRLDDAGGMLTQAELQSSLQWEKSRLSHQLTRMEGRLFVKRSPSGKRSPAIHILPNGRLVVELARPVHAAAVRQLVLQFFTDEEQSTLVKIVSRLPAA